MALLTLRQIKGFPITDNEMDANFTNLNRDSFLSVRNSTSWIANTTYSAGEFLNVGDRFYYVQNTGTTGSVAPTHTSGSAVNGTITLVASASSPYYSAKDVLDKIKLLDGINSGLDADILQGLTPFSLLPITPDKSSIVSRDSVGNSAFNNITVASINGISITNFIVNGSNATLGNLSTTGNTTLGDAGTDTLTINSQVSANGSVGTFGQVLTSRGTNNSPQWTTITQGDMFRADNLAGLTNISLARTNIGAASLGANTFTGDQIVPDEAYDAAGWNGDFSVPTKNAVRDKIETIVKNIVDDSTTVKINRQNSTYEGGQLGFARAVDNETGFYLDVAGNDTLPVFRTVAKNYANSGADAIVYQIDNHGTHYTGIPSTGQILPSYHCRAWVNFNGLNGAIRGSGNVSSITDNGIGDYTINFTVAMPDTNYNALPVAGLGSTSAIGSSSVAWPAVYSTGSVRIGVSDNNTDANRDVLNVNVSIFR